MSASSVPCNLGTAIQPACYPVFIVSRTKRTSCCSTRVYRRKDVFSFESKRCSLKSSIYLPCLRRAKTLAQSSMDSNFGTQSGDFSISVFISFVSGSINLLFVYQATNESLKLSGFMEYPGSSSIFSRINIWDPYKRLGISKEASLEEIEAAKNYLIAQHKYHKPSVEAIESAYYKVLQKSFRAKRKPKYDIKGKWKNVTESNLIRGIYSRFETPNKKVIIKTASLFLVLAIWSFLRPTEDGPIYQVLISLAASIYFIYARLKRRMKAVLYGCTAFLSSWVLGSFLMATLLPPIVGGPRSLEASTSIVSYIFLWIASTYLK